MTHPPDDLAPLLHPPPGPPADADRRNELLLASTRVLRRRVLLRRAVSALAAVVLFLAGGVTGWVLKPTAVPEVVQAPSPEPADPPPLPPPAPPPLSAGELELKAELSDDPAEVARLYREAGDAYLTVEKDYAQAARCYRLHLQAADPDTRRIAVSDSWLLMGMKSSVQ